jgi:hypothetical protein
MPPRLNATRVKVQYATAAVTDGAASYNSAKRGNSCAVLNRLQVLGNLGCVELMVIYESLNPNTAAR